MARMRTLATTVLLALLVAVTLSLPGESGQAAAVEPRTVTAKIMIPAAAFTPARDYWNHYGQYENQGDRLTIDTWEYFVAPLVFPVPEVTIRRITMWATDDHMDRNVCVLLYRSSPARGQEATRLQGRVCTTGRSINPQVLHSVAISPRAVHTAVHSSFLRLDVGVGGQFQHLHAVQITYSYETGA